MKYVICLGFLFSAALLFSQEAHELPLEQQLQITKYGLEFEAPDVPYKVNKSRTGAFQTYDFGLFFRKEKLEVRYLFVPDTDSDATLIPHLRVPRMAMHLATNEEDGYLSAHAIEPAQLDSVYRADWGQTFFFRPKSMFSPLKDCQMTAIYREGVGLFYVFLLFDDPPATLPERADMIKFNKRELLD